MTFSEGLVLNTAVSDQYKKSGLMFSADNSGLVYIADTAVVGGGGNGHVLAVNSVGGIETTLKINFVNPVNGNQAVVPASSIRLLVSDTNADPSPRVIIRAHAIDGTILATVDATNETGYVTFAGSNQVAYLTLEDNGADGFIIDDLRYGPINCSPTSSSSSASSVHSSSSSVAYSSSSSLSSSSSSHYYSSSSYHYHHSSSSSRKSWWHWDDDKHEWTDENGDDGANIDANVDSNAQSTVEAGNDCDILIQQAAEGRDVDQDALAICLSETNVNVEQNVESENTINVNQQSGIDQPLNVAHVGIKLASISKNGKTTFIPQNEASVPMVVVIMMMSAGLVGSAVIGRKMWL